MTQEAPTAPPAEIEFGDNHKVIRTDGGVSCLFLDKDQHRTPGQWLAPDVFACTPSPFGEGTWAAVICSKEVVRTLYWDGRRSYEKVSAQEIRDSASCEERIWSQENKSRQPHAPQPQPQQAAMSAEVREAKEEAERLRKAKAAFPKVAGLKLPDPIDVVAEELCKLGVSAESELEFLEEDDFKRLSLKPVSRGKIKRLAEAMQEGGAGGGAAEGMAAAAPQHALPQQQVATP